MNDKIMELLESLIVSDELDKCTLDYLSKKLKISKNDLSIYLIDLYDSDQLIYVYENKKIYLSKHYFEKKYNREFRKEYPSLHAFEKFLLDEKLENFDKLIGNKDSLSGIVDKIKATVSYPEQGLPLLLQGPTGTGKTFMAKLAYEYCIDTGLIESNKQFVQVNCSEYTHNPELLTANLFGYKKGAFTGADSDNLGLLHFADGGVLFLDEVHGLKAECQEKLFLYMDQGIYHLLGDNDKWYESKCRIIFATTENPKKVLLKTLQRRIPVMLEIPSLAERGLNEKMALIHYLYKKEEQRIEGEIRISSNVYQVLLETSFVGNIGELANVIQSSCVNALYEQPPGFLDIQVYHLPEEIMARVNPTILLGSTQQMMHLDALVPKMKNEKIICLYDNLISLLDHSQNFEEDARRLIEEYTEDILFSKKYKGSNYALDIITRVMDMVTDRYGFRVSRNELVSIANFVSEYHKNAHIIVGWKEKYQDQVSRLIQYVESNFSKEYRIAKEAFDFFKYNLNESLDEMALIIITVSLRKYINHNLKSKTLSIILAHGFSTASSIAESVNKLLDTYIFDAIDMPLNVDSSSIANKLSSYLDEIGQIDQLYLLVDMGSLENIYRGLELKGTNVALINNVSTKLALQIGDGIKQNKDMEDIFDEIEKAEPYNIQLEINKIKEPVILCSCASGTGTAMKLQKIISDSLPPEKNIKVQTYDYATLLEKKLNDSIFLDKEIVCVIGTLDPNLTGVKYIGIEDLIIETGNENLREYFKNYFDEKEMEIFEKNILKNFSLTNVMNSLTILNPTKLLEQVSKAIDELQVDLNMIFKNNTCFGLYVHICCLIERLLTNQQVMQLNNQNFAKEHSDFILSVKKVMKEVERFYNVDIPIEEIEYIYDYVKNN